MGNAPGKLNSSTSNSNATACDGGSLVPNGIYPEDAQDFDAKVVQRLILVRQMAPFYAGADDPDPEVASTNTKANLTLEDNNADANDNADADGDDAAVAIAAAVVVGSADQTKKNDDGWWSYNMMLAQHEQQQKQSMEEYENSAHSLGASTSSLAEGSAASPGRRSGHARVGSGFFQRLKNSHQRSPSSAAAAANSDPQSPLAFPKHSSPSLSPAPTHQHLHNHDRSFSDQQQQPPVDLQKLLRRHVECPICFLYYPQNINYTRCCHKPLCTECFVQIKRKLDDDLITPTHCPYCVEVNLGIIYYAPVGVRGLMTASLAGGGFVDDSRGRAHSFSGGRNANNNTGEPLIVMSDDIRPGLVKELGAEIEAKRREQERSAENMALVAAATRRASARTARAGRSQGAAAGSGSGSSSRQRRLVAVAPEYAAYASAMRAAGQTDLEEFLIQEAIRMSLAAQEGEQQQRNVTAADPLEPLAEQPEESAAAPTAGLGDAIDAIDPAEPIANQADPAEPIADTNQPISAPALAPLTLDAAELEAIASITSRCKPSISHHSLSPRPAAAATTAEASEEGPAESSSANTISPSQPQPQPQPQYNLNNFNGVMRRPPPVPPGPPRHGRASSNPFFSRMQMASPPLQPAAVPVAPLLLGGLTEEPRRNQGEEGGVRIGLVPNSPPVRTRRRAPPPPPPQATTPLSLANRVRNRSASSNASTGPNITSNSNNSNNSNNNNNNGGSGNGANSQQQPLIFF